eukprot:TRINITY_DN5112_c0_g1_i1.p1 TRINITY_DN5112_c0_g1~~TRINITY_DN5112_c0_g1_i1.p1  ORF type:complete len:135 (+),score=12.74 TRINITY_DN5112_c0_g1_i1:231-635(+)
MQMVWQAAPKLVAHMLTTVRAPVVGSTATSHDTTRVGQHASTPHWHPPGRATHSTAPTSLSHMRLWCLALPWSRSHTRTPLEWPVTSRRSCQTAQVAQGKGTKCSAARERLGSRSTHTRLSNVNAPVLCVDTTA